MIVLTYTALYREWRPKTFNDVVGQEHITTTELLMRIFFVEQEEQVKLLQQKFLQKL